MAVAGRPSAIQAVPLLLVALGLCSCSGSAGSIDGCAAAGAEADVVPEALGLLQARATPRRPAVSTVSTAAAAASTAVTAVAHDADTSKSAASNLDIGGGAADGLALSPGLRVQERRGGMIDYSGFWQCNSGFDDGIREFRQSGIALQVLTACQTWIGTVQNNGTFDLVAHGIVSFHIICTPQGDRILCSDGGSCDRVHELSSFDAPDQLQGKWFNVLDKKPGATMNLQFNYSNNDEWMRLETKKVDTTWTNYTGRLIQNGSMFQTCLCENGTYSLLKAQLKLIQGQLQCNLGLGFLNASEQVFDPVTTISFFEDGAAKGKGFISSPAFLILCLVVIIPLMCLPMCLMFRNMR